MDSASHDGPKAAWPAVLLLALCTAIAQGMARFSYGPLVPAMLGREVGSASTAGALAMAHMTGYLIGSVFVLRLGSRWAPIQSVRAGIFLTTLGLGVLAVSPTTSALAVGLIATGFGAAMTWILAPNIAASLWPARRGVAIGLVAGSMGIGLIAASGLASAVPEKHWRSVWAIECAVAAVIWVSAMKVLTAPHMDRSTHEKIRLPWRIDAAWSRSTAAFATFSFGVAMCLTFLVAGLEHSMGGGQLYARLAYASIGIGMLAGGVLFERLSRRWGRTVTLSLQYLLFALSLSAVLRVPERGVVIVVIIVIGATMTGTAATLIADLTDRHSTSVATALFGSVFLPVGLGQVLGPIFGGWAIDTFDFETAFTACGALSVAGAAPLLYGALTTRPR
ncbi:MFS transporter [Rhodococcus sp. WS4]|nr:MFS transporter [Rhodococcus sp. WS4]